MNKLIKIALVATLIPSFASALPPSYGYSGSDVDTTNNLPSTNMIIRGSIGSGLSGGSSSFNGGFGSSETATAGGGFSGNLINRSFDKMNNMQSLAKPTITNLDTASGNNPTHNMNLNGVDDGLSLK